MSAKLSTTAKCTRIWMIAVIVMFLALGLMRVPAMNLETSKLVILILGVNCLAVASLAGIALSPMSPTKPQEICEDV